MPCARRRAADPDALPCASIQATLDAVRAGRGRAGRGADRELGRGRRHRHPGRARSRHRAGDLRRGAGAGRVRAAGQAWHELADVRAGRRPPGGAAAVPAAGWRPTCRTPSWLPAASNSDAAGQVAEGELDAALAGVFAAELYGLVVLATGVHDRDDAVTRFVAVRLPGELPVPDRRLTRRRSSRSWPMITLARSWTSSASSPSGAST